MGHPYNFQAIQILVQVFISIFLTPYGTFCVLFMTVESQLIVGENNMVKTFLILLVE